MTNNVTCAIVPARGGSKGIPRKNLRTVGGATLIERAVRTLRRVPSIDHVVVTTDDPEIALNAEYAGALVVARPLEMASDTASSEVAVLHALDELATRGLHPDITVFAQATSPFVREQDVDRAVSRLIVDPDLDVVFSAVETDAFLWQVTAEGLRGVNHDWTRRPRRQERPTQFQETGGFYVMRTSGFRAARYRFFGTVSVQRVPVMTAMEIDTFDDLELAQQLAERPMPQRHFPGSLSVEALAMDFDGVHTDNAAYLDETGREAVRVNRSDGMGLAMLRRSGLPMVILSTETNPVVAARGRKLGIDVIQGLEDKAAALQTWMEAQGVPSKHVAYVGNDINDLTCFELVGWPIAVADAHPTVQQAARIILEATGGNGALRELAELVSAPKRQSKESIV